MKKWTCYLLIGIVASGILAGCSSGDETPGADTPKPEAGKVAPKGQEAQTAKPSEPL
jgi:hypothetical protein